MISTKFYHPNLPRSSCLVLLLKSVTPELSENNLDVPDYFMKNDVRYEDVKNDLFLLQKRISKHGVKLCKSHKDT